MSPPLAVNALRFFDIAARHESFVNAADELHLTHGAVSRQIRLLEESLGIALFERRNRAVFLTPAGVQLQAATQHAFAHLATVIDTLRQTPLNTPLVVSCEPTIAMKWLIPRQSDFYRRHPDIRLHIVAAGGPVAFRRDGIDVALRRNDFIWDAEFYTEKICVEKLGPVCAPSLVKRGRIDLSQQTLLHTASRKSAWPKWRKTTRSAASQAGAQTYEHFYLSLQAARAALGVAMGSFLMVQEELSSGRLVAPFGFVEDGSAYYLVSPTPIDSDPRQAVFLAWLKEQMAQPE